MGDEHFDEFDEYLPIFYMLPKQLCGCTYDELLKGGEGKTQHLLSNDSQEEFNHPQNTFEFHNLLISTGKCISKMPSETGDM